MTDSEYVRGLTPPKPWPPPPRRVDHYTLTLEEVLLVRHRLAGKSYAEIGSELGRNAVWVSNRIQKARARFGGAAMEDFLRMPELLDAVREDA